MKQADEWLGWPMKDARPPGETVTLPRDSQRRPLTMRVGARLSTWWFRRRFGRCGPGSLIERPSLLIGARWIHIGDRVQIWHSARLEVLGASGQGVHLSIGDGSVIGPSAHIGAVRRVAIGRDCLFASGVYVTDHDHDYSNPDDPVVSNGRLVSLPTIIEDQVWLGERAIVLKGVTVGRCSVVGAGSVVTKCIPPYSIAVGSPARVVRIWDSRARAWAAV